MLSQPGLHVEEIDVEISWRWHPATGRTFAGVLIRAATGVVETPAHQAHLKEGEVGVGTLPRSQPQAPTSLVPSKACLVPPQGQDPVTPVLRASPLSPHLKKPEPPLKENCSPRFSCQKGGTRDCHPDSHRRIRVVHRCPGMRAGQRDTGGLPLRNPDSRVGTGDEKWGEGAHPCRDCHPPASHCIGTGLSPPL